MYLLPSSHITEMLRVLVCSTMLPVYKVLGLCTFITLATMWDIRVSSYFWRGLKYCMRLCWDAQTSLDTFVTCFGKKMFLGSKKFVKIYKYLITQHPLHQLSVVAHVSETVERRMVWYGPLEQYRGWVSLPRMVHLCR